MFVVQRIPHQFKTQEHCVECRRDYQRRWRAANREKERQRFKMYRRKCRKLKLCSYCGCALDRKGIYCSKCARRHNLRYKKYRQRIRIEVITRLGSRCIGCGETDIRVLQVNHKNGGGNAERRKLGKGTEGNGQFRIFLAVLRGDRPINDLDVRCANCNLLFEYESGRRYYLNSK